MLDRLDRVEHCTSPAPRPRPVLDELRALVTEAEDWLAADGPGTEDAERALDRCRTALDARSTPVSA